jgi:hypothetical protein
MTRARVLDRLLRLALAFVLGLGPLGASLLAASLHTPLCGCAGCGPASTEPSCCSSRELDPSGPALRAAEDPCACSLVGPHEEPSRAARVCPTRERVGDLQVARDREPARLPRAWAAARGVEPAPGRSSPPGPPGSRRLRGTARAAARGLLLL